MLDLDAFRIGRELLRGIRSTPDLEPHVVECLENGLLTLCEASYTFEKHAKLRLLRAARSEMGRAVGHLALSAAEDPNPWITALENDLLPSMAGLLRWAESLAEAA